jgi:glycosyltransferase involved in cell wall biosynthesis
VSRQPERGGQAWKDKAIQFLSLPIMLVNLSKTVWRADAIQVRCPGNLGLLGALIAPLFSRYRIAKYAGQWSDYDGEARSYRLQRAILSSKWWGAPVIVYGEWPNQPAHIKPFFTSVMDLKQVTRAKSACMDKQLHDPLRVIFVGRLSRSKNVHVLLDALGKLHSKGMNVEARIIGEGPELPALKTLSIALDLPQTAISFLGGMSFEDVLSNYEWADVLVLASETEGWPKAIAEGMAFGLVCIGSHRGLVPQMLADGRGLVVEPGDPAALVCSLENIIRKHVDFPSMSRKAAEWGQRYSLDGLKRALQDLLIHEWHLNEHELRSV